MFGHFLSQCRVYQGNNSEQVNQFPQSQQAISNVSLYEGQQDTNKDKEVEDFFVGLLYTSLLDGTGTMFKSGDFMEDLVEVLSDLSEEMDFLANLEDGDEIIKFFKDKDITFKQTEVQVWPFRTTGRSFACQDDSISY